MSENLKVCLAASGGGHLSQLLKLAQAWDGCEVFWVTTTAVVQKNLSQYGKVYVTGECNREHPLRVFLVLIRCLKIVWHERPEVVISTGAAVGCLMCFLGKLCGSKVVWLDSITNVQRLSLSGRMVRRIADLFLVQWPELASRSAKTEYIGTVI